MPPKANPQKRKRGRPTNASRAHDAPGPAQHEANEDQDEDEIATAESPENLRGSSRPERRKREASGGEDELEGEPAPKRRRGRPSRDNARAEGKEEQAVEAPTTQKKRGRPKAIQPVITAEEAQDEASEAPNRRKRGKARGAQEIDMPTEVKSPRRRGRPRKSELGEEAPELRRRGRPRRSDGSDAAAEAPGPKKRGRPKRADASDVAEPAEPKRRGRLRRSDASDTAEQPSQPKRRGRPRQSDSSNAGPSQQRPPTAEPSDIDSPDAPDPDQPKRSYPFLAAKQREIPVSTISSTWTPLQSPSLTLARQILHFSERPVLQSLAPGPRREVAASAIRTASKRLASKLSKGLPFPPASKAAVKASKKSKTPRADGREAELDFEAVVSEMEALEGRLDPLLHSVEVLRVEERRMQELLSREAAALEVLERNGREERKLWREGLRRKGHPLVPDRWDPDGDGGDKLVLTPRGEEVPSEWLFTNNKPSLPLSTLTSHITSLHNNVRPLEGLDRAMADSEAAIRRVLAQALEPERYEAAIMAERE